MDFERTTYFNELIFKLPIKPFKAINVSFMISIQFGFTSTTNLKKKKNILNTISLFVNSQ